MSRIARNFVIAFILVALPFILDRWIRDDSRALSAGLMPGFAASAFLAEHGLITAFDPSGDLTLQAAFIAFVANIVVWLAIVSSIAWLLDRRARKTPPNSA